MGPALDRLAPGEGELAGAGGLAGPSAGADLCIRKPKRAPPFRKPELLGVASELERAASRELPSKKPVASFEPTPRELFILITLYPAYAVAEFLTLCLKKKPSPPSRVAACQQVSPLTSPGGRKEALEC